MSTINSNAPTAKWANVTIESPCLICGKADWCARTADGCFAICRRCHTSGQFGAGKEKADASGGLYWVYRLSVQAPPPWPAPTCLPADGKGERADAATLHQVYSAVLLALPLTYEHRVRLRARGLTDNVIDGLGYRSLSPARAAAVRKLIEAGLEPVLPRVPGLYVRDKQDGNSYWTVSGPCGILIPVRDHGGRVIALLIRCDADDSPKKYTLASSKKYGGAGPGSPVHIPLHDAIDLTTIRITEGTLKGDIATIRSNVLTIGLPGVGAWRRAAKILTELGAKTARLAFDADARVNRTVATALSRLAIDLQTSGFAVELDRWNIKDGKGIDDLLATGKIPEVLTGDSVSTAIEEILAEAAKTDPVPGLTIPDGKPVEANDDPHRLASLFMRKGLLDFGK